MKLFYTALLLCTSAFANISPITPEIFEQMSFSWKESSPVPLEDLRCVTVKYWGFDDNIHEGSVIMHKIVAEEIAEIFDELLENRFPIEKIQFVDLYQADDELSAGDNNTYSYCCRPNTTFPNVFSKHSYGFAIDINPLYNPYHRGSLIVPQSGEPYLDRNHDVKGMIHPDSACYQAFTKRGWTWGGDWPLTRGYADYQHFEKDPALYIK